MLLFGGIGMIIVIGGLLFPGVFPKPIDPASKLFLESKAKAEHGDAQAQLDLGIRCLQGSGVRRNDEEAVKWFRKSAGQNCAAGQLELAYCYTNGRGVAQDQA